MNVFDNNKFIVDELTNSSLFGYKFWQAIYNERQDIDFPLVLSDE